MKILLGTKNEHKKKEFMKLFEDMDIEFVSLKDLGFEGEIEENGSTFKENALIKAKKSYELYGIPALADDSGICIDAFNGKPGIYSARFAGYNTPSSSKNSLIINLLKGNSNRGAHYTCALAFFDGKETFISEEYCYGEIISDERGSEGFGYDPIFYLKDYDKTMAEIPLEEKNKISHRGKALEKFKEFIKNR